jgi:nitroimidazol reductase NimA-like FMN-containing flavoprotein (pyridoxamine 5'-phosphate oxidase superfamily)
MKRPKRQLRPTFRDLTRAECDALLERNRVGRIAFTFRDRVDIEPVHYVYAKGWLHGRTSPGTKIATLRHHPWVAFEVDETKGLYDWRSVVVHGVVHLPDRDGSPDDSEAYESTLRLIRKLEPLALETGDPTPMRQVLFRIHVDEVTGRAASTSSVRHVEARVERRIRRDDEASPG